MWGLQELPYPVVIPPAFPLESPEELKKKNQLLDLRVGDFDSLDQGWAPRNQYSSKALQVILRNARLKRHHSAPDSHSIQKSLQHLHDHLGFISDLLRWTSHTFVRLFTEL